MAVIRTPSLGEFAARLLSLEDDIKEASERAVERGAKMVAKKAKQLIGREHPEWPALSPATIEDKRRHGYRTPAPLLRTGSLRDSIEWSEARWEDAQTCVAYAGTNHPLAPFHEFGTSKMPPRPFISLAARGQERIIVDKMAETYARVMDKGGASRHMWKHVIHDVKRAAENFREMMDTDEDDGD